MILKDLNDALKGTPDGVLTILLVGLAIAVLIVALKGPPLLKATMAAWVLLP